jgi:hypothetical protein
MPKLKEKPANKATRKVIVSKQIQDKAIKVTLWDGAKIPKTPRLID